MSWNCLLAPNCVRMIPAGILVLVSLFSYTLTLCLFVTLCHMRAHRYSHYFQTVGYPMPWFCSLLMSSCPQVWAWINIVDDFILCSSFIIELSMNELHLCKENNGNNPTGGHVLLCYRGRLMIFGWFKLSWFQNDINILSLYAFNVYIDITILFVFWG